MQTLYLGCGLNDAFSTLDSCVIDRVPWLGKWEGSFTDTPNEVFTVNIVFLGMDPNPFDNGIRHYDYQIYNFPEGCGGPWAFQANPSRSRSRIRSGVILDGFPSLSMFR